MPKITNSVMRLFRALGSVFLLGAGLAGCSVINSFDELAEVSVDQTGGAGVGGSGSGGMAGDTGSGGSTGGTDTGGAAGAGGDEPSGGTGGTGGTVEVPDGLVVVFGEDTDRQDSTPSDQEVLSVLSPQTGEELASEDGAFPGIAYEMERDLWFVLKSDSTAFQPAPADNIVLEARSFDRATNEWTVLNGSPPRVDTPYGIRALYAMPDRLALLTLSSSLQVQLVVYDTSDPGDLREVTSRVTLEDGGEIRTATVVPLSVGGRLQIVRKAPCDGSLGVCASSSQLELQRVDITPSGVQAFQAEPILEIDGATSDASAATDPGGFVVMGAPDTSAPPISQGYVQLFSATDQTTDGTKYLFPLGQAELKSMVVDPCNRVAYLTGPQIKSVIGVPLTTTMGRPETESLNDVGKGLVYEPYTRTLIVPLDSDNEFGLTALTLGGTPDSPSLSPRSVGTWQPPRHLKPRNVVAAQADGTHCVQ